MWCARYQVLQAFSVRRNGLIGIEPQPYGRLQPLAAPSGVSGPPGHRTGRRGVSATPAGAPDASDRRSEARRGVKDARAILLDEFVALGRLEAVERATGLMVGYGLQLWPILQDMSQLRDLYEARASTFIANAGVQQVFGVNDFETAKWISQTMGQETIGYQTESRKPGDTGLSRNVNKS